MTRELPQDVEGPELGSLDSYWVNTIRNDFQFSASYAFGCAAEARADGNHTLALVHDTAGRAYLDAAHKITRIGAKFAMTPEETP